MSLGAITSLVAYGLGAEATRFAIRASSKYAISGAKNLLSKGLPKLQAAADLSKRGAFHTLLAKGGLKTSGALAKRERSGRAMARILERRTNNISRTINRIPGNIARKAGVRKSWARKAVIDTVKTEAQYMPFNYLMYRYEKNEGSISKDTNFAKFYATSVGPMSMGFNMATHGIKRAGKLAKTLTMATGGGRAMQTATHLGMEMADFLGKKSRNIARAHNFYMSRVHGANSISMGFFSGPMKAAREVAKERMKQSRTVTDLDAFRQNLKGSTNSLDVQKELIGSYNKTMEGGKLLKGYNNFLKKANKYEGKLGGGKSLMMHTIENVKKEIQIGSSKVSAIESRELYSFGNKQYDFGALHLDNIRDTINSAIIRDFRVAGTPWLNFLDAGRNLMMSKRTRTIGSHFSGSTVPGYLGLRGGKGIYVGAPGNTELYNNHVDENDIGALRDLSIGTMTNWLGSKSGSKTKALNVLDSSLRSTKEWLSQSNTMTTKFNNDMEKVEKTFYMNFIANAKHGIFKLSPNQTLDLMSGKAKVLTETGHSTVDMIFHHDGKPMDIAYAVSGSSRAGQIVGMLAGKEVQYTSKNGNIDVLAGISYQKNIAADERFMRSDQTTPDNWLIKLSKLTEWGGGHEQSLIGTVASVFTKFKDDNYFGTWANKLNSGKINRKQLEHRFKNNVENRSSMTSAVHTFTNNLLGEAFQDIRVLGTSGKGINSGYKGYGDIFNELWGGIKRGLSIEESAAVPEIDFRRLVINKGVSRKSSLKSLTMLDDIMNENHKLFEDSGFDFDMLTKLKHTLSTSKDPDAWAAASITDRGKAGTIIDKYHKNLFDSMLSISVESKQGVSNTQSTIIASEFIAGISAKTKTILGKSNMSTQLEANDIRSAVSARYKARKFKNKAGENYISDFIDDVVTLGNVYDKHYTSTRNLMRSFGDKKGLTDPASADNILVLVPDNVPLSLGAPKLHKFTHLGANETTEVAKLPIGKFQLETMAAVGTMNSALSLLGLGFDVSSTIGLNDIIGKTLTKRVLPFAGLYAAHEAVTTIADNTPGLRDTSLAGGVPELLLDAYAGTRVASAYFTDFTGITSMSQYMEDLLPGSIASPLSGLIRGVAPVIGGLKMGQMSRLGPVRGGMVGGAVGMLLGGGPLGMFGDWNIDKGREEVINELTGKKDVAIGSGRWWELSGDSFLGGKTKYFRPHMYSLLKNKFTSGDNYLGNDLVDRMTSYVDPSVYARQHYYSRPFPEGGSFGTNVPIVGTVAASLPGVSGLVTERYHQDFMQDMQGSSMLMGGGSSPMGEGDLSLTGDSYFSQSNYGGGSSESPGGIQTFSSTSVENSIGTATNNIMDIAGLRGFMTATMLDGITGSPNIVSGARIMESSDKIGSMSRQYWNMNLGGMLGLSEAIRRIIPNERNDVEYYNPIPNAMPLWMPGAGSFKDFLVGDPYSDIEMGETRIMGSTYELTHDVSYTYPIDAITMGRTLEEQVSYYAGDVMYMTALRRNWNVVERSKGELIGRMKKYMNIKREKQVAYDSKNNATAYVDAIVDDPNKGLMAINIAPIVDTNNGSIADPSAIEQMNAYLVLNSKGIREGLVILMDKDGNTTKQMVHADMKRYQNEIRKSVEAINIAKTVTLELEQEGRSINRGVAYSHLNRLKILADVAPFSKEAQVQVKIVKEQLKKGMLDDNARGVYSDIMRQFGTRMNSLRTSEYRFIPYLMGKTPLGNQAIERMEEVGEKYGQAESIIGAGYEYLTHLRNPIFNKLVSKESAYEAYRRDVAIGKGFKTWQSAYDDFIVSNLSMVASEQDPFQALISGSTGGGLFAGPVGAAVGGGAAFFSSLLGLTSNTRASRWERVDEIQQMGDMLKYRELSQMQEESVADQTTLANRAKRTSYANYQRGGQSGYMDVLGGLSGGERKYMRAIMNNLYAEDVDKISGLLPKHVSPIFKSFAQGSPLDMSQSAVYSTKMRTNVEAMPLNFRTEDVIHQTLSNEGYNSHDVGIGWFCIPDGISIRTRHKYVKIEHMKTETKIINRNGIDNVDQIHTRKAKDEVMVTLKTSHNKLDTPSATSEHEVLVSDLPKYNDTSSYLGVTPKWKSIGDIIEKKDWICIPRGPLFKDKNQLIDTFKIITESTLNNNEIYRNNNYTIVGANSKNKQFRGVRIPRYCIIDYNFCRLVGLWISDGSLIKAISKNKDLRYGLDFTVHIDRKELIDFIVNTLKDKFDLTAHIYKPKKTKKNCVTIRISSVALGSLFFSLFGEYFDGKYLSEDFIDSISNNAAMGLLKGLNDGDGCIKYTDSKIIGLTYCHANENLCRQITEILTVLGFNPSISKRKPQKNRYGKSIMFIVNINTPSEAKSILKNILPKERSKYTFFRVLSVEKNVFSGRVWDMSINKDHSYSTYNCTFHNSQVNRLKRIEAQGNEIPTFGVPFESNVIPVLNYNRQ